MHTFRTSTTYHLCVASAGVCSAVLLSYVFASLGTAMLAKERVGVTPKRRNEVLVHMVHVDKEIKNTVSHSIAVNVIPYERLQQYVPEELGLAHPGREIHIDIGLQKMLLMEDGIPVRMYPVSSGMTYTPTPLGEFQIHRKQDLRISSQGVPYRMPYYMAFVPNQGFGIHALPYLGNSPEDSNYWHEARTSIGLRASHGCVRLLEEDAIALYNWVEVGTPVHIAIESRVRDYIIAFEQKNIEAAL